MKPTTPAIPSPLRQTWKESDSSPQAEVTPTKKPDVSNPYQTASPVKPPAPVRKPVVKRAKPAAKPAEKPKEQEPEISAQAIIEATVPKYTKRSRPPPEMETHGEEVSDNKPFTSMPNGSTHTIRSVFDVVETVTVREEERSSKRRKTSSAGLSFKAQEIDEASVSKEMIRPAEIIEPADDAHHVNGKPAPPPKTTPSPPSATKPLFGIAKTSAPKEPSKLRYSFHADKVEVKNTDSVTAPPLPSFFEPPPALSPTFPKGTTAPAKPKLSLKEEVLAMSVDELPKYTFLCCNILFFPSRS
ncbi:hypothetical protein EV363DRAFT_1443599 [Boletus edulis]|nr:hypothetical protein EV363DRAFT_1443599 [Boletus edulis]